MARSDDPLAKRQGYALLNGLSQMSGLSPDDAVLVQALTRPLIERTLSEGRRSEEVVGEEVEFHVGVYDDAVKEGEDATHQGDS